MYHLSIYFTVFCHVHVCMYQEYSVLNVYNFQEDVSECDHFMQNANKIKINNKEEEE